MAIW
jgi:hypothetical protein